MNFDVLAEVSEEIRSTAKKKEKISLIAGLLLQVRGEEISLAAHYLAGNLPGGKLGIGWSTVEDAMRDLQPSPYGLQLMDIQNHLEDLRKTTGPGSSKKKRRILRALFFKMGEQERKFLVGLILGEIRQGALEGLVLEAIAEAISLPVDSIRQAFMFSGDIGQLAEVALEEGSAGLGRFGPTLFHPVSPMLASPVEGEQEALARLGEAAWEYKVDGARIQIHKGREEIRIFTRHLKEVTDRLPEIVAVARRFPMEEGIFEGEAIALATNGKPYPFQTTMRRFGRILDVERMQREIPLFCYFFDLLYLDGQALFAHPYRERFALLRPRISPQYLIPHIMTADEKVAGAFLRRSLAAGHEGLMAKGLASPYVAGQRGFHWLKIKPARTLDLVVLAAEWGHGRRKGWLSNLHLGARDPKSEQFIMLGKTFKGLTDKMLRWVTDKLLRLETDRNGYTVYVRPELVVEIAYNDLQESPRYPGGLALRFARVRRFREDKSPDQTDTIQAVWSIFETSRRSIAKPA